ncbi:hydrogen gas-evolving membrane-bound hydrogenase subunit E [Aquibaculum arenosum]|uniref:MnhB domain-containing protein n=1 Tax=Aquibaculum arenosum TaxID=3032591 RepID=A0ABT5YJU9_9PROT|nr:hydrogen gas-evolving membrane-bound hydrogenase subunit E [Fodinicurvata sp. CAU 1616]MDF2094539.1 MnhB domain-containing protein [Fodinicurvata sp. CAU 1616]
MFGIIDEREQPFGLSATLLALGALVAFVGLAYVAVTLAGEATGLGEPVRAALPRSGLDNPVNAVLINFRAFDTLLEKAVLLLALVGLWGLMPEAPWSVPSGNFLTPGAAEPQLLLLLKALAPLVLLSAFYLFWLGAEEAGGAFQAGTILSAVTILLVLGKVLPAPPHGAAWLRAVAAAGFLLFAGVGLAVGLGNGVFLDYPEALAKPLILIIEAGIALSVAVLLFLLASGLPREKGERQ